MKQAVTYSVVKRRNLKNFESGETLYYAVAQARGELGIREISDRIQHSCTVTRADIMAVLISMSTVIIEGLKSGQIVRIGDLGCLQLGVSSEGTETAEEFTEANIKKARINFRPGTDLSESLDGLSFERVPVKYSKSKEEEITPEEADV